MPCPGVPATLPMAPSPVSIVQYGHLAEPRESPAEELGVEVDQPLRLRRVDLEVHDQVRHGMPPCGHGSRWSEYRDADRPVSTSA